MGKKEALLYGVAYLVINFLISSGIFVTYQSMTAYASPKSDIIKIEQRLARIEDKLDKLIMRY